MVILKATEKDKRDKMNGAGSECTETKADRERQRQQETKDKAPTVYYPCWYADMIQHMSHVVPHTEGLKVNRQNKETN